MDTRVTLKTHDSRTVEGTSSVERAGPKSSDGWAVKEKTRTDWLPPDSWRSPEEQSLEERRRAEKDVARAERARIERRAQAEKMAESRRKDRELLQERPTRAGGSDDAREGELVARAAGDVTLRDKTAAVQAQAHLDSEDVRALLT